MKEKKIFPKNNMGIKKTQNLMLYFKSVEKVEKTNGVLNFYYCVKKYTAYNFFHFCLLDFFAMDSNSALDFAFYDIHIEL
jgi:hypothetical protein